MKNYTSQNYGGSQKQVSTIGWLQVFDLRKIHSRKGCSYSVIFQNAYHSV